MVVEFFGSWDEAAAAMRAAEDAANARTRPEQWDVTYGDHWVSAAQLYGEVLVIFGRVWTLAEHDESSRGCDPEEAEAERRMTAASYGRGYRFGEAWSLACPEGELGDTHVSTMHPLNANEFAEAKERGWDFARCVADRLPWALALVRGER